MSRAYYSENNPDAVAVLSQLIEDDVIAPGDVDDRSIKDVSPDDLHGYTQCHFFAGGGLWSVAARLAGWPDTRPLWTGSCPCQPFSVAGQRAGTDDPRHLWPDFYRLIRAGRPPVVMGEQVAGKAGRNWFNGVRADLEGGGYAGRAVDIPACAVDAPHERNRLYWIAVADAERSERREGDAAGDGDLGQEGGRIEGPNQSGKRDAGGGVGDADSLGEQQQKRSEREGRRWTSDADANRALGDACGSGLSASGREAILGAGRREERRATEQSDGPLPGRNGSWWADAEWIECHDGKARRAKPSSPLLVDGLPGRVGLWRIAGNAISPVLAAEAIAAFLDAERDEHFRSGVTGEPLAMPATPYGRALQGSAQHPRLEDNRR